MTLGEIGEIKTTSRPVMHIRLDGPHIPLNLKWRGATLSDFNGKAWFEPTGDTRIIRPMEKGTFHLADDAQRRRHAFEPHLNYHISVNGIDSNVLFFAGIPEMVYLNSAR